MNAVWVDQLTLGLELLRMQYPEDGIYYLPYHEAPDSSVSYINAETRAMRAVIRGLSDTTHAAHFACVDDINKVLNLCILADEAIRGGRYTYLSKTRESLCAEFTEEVVVSAELSGQVGAATYSYLMGRGNPKWPKGDPWKYYTFYESNFNAIQETHRDARMMDMEAIAGLLSSAIQEICKREGIDLAQDFKA